MAAAAKMAGGVAMCHQAYVDTCYCSLINVCIFYAFSLHIKTRLVQSCSKLNHKYRNIWDDSVVELSQNSNYSMRPTVLTKKPPAMLTTGHCNLCVATDESLPCQLPYDFSHHGNPD